MIHRPVIFGLILFAFMFPGLHAQTVLSRAVIASGGSDMSQGNHRIKGTVGQSVIGWTSSATRIAGQGFWYQVQSIPTTISEPCALPAEAVLHQNYPNPFNPSTTIEFILLKRAHVRLLLYRPSGTLLDVLIDDPLDAGTHRVRFEAGDIPAGMYIYRLISEMSHAEHKMLLLK